MKRKLMKGFTLIELLIVIAIIAILTVAFLPTLRGGQASARDAARRSMVEQLVIAIERIANGDFASASPAIPGAIPSSAGLCLDFAAGVGLNIRQALSTVPTTQTNGTDLSLCNGGYFYRSYLATGIPGAGTQANYFIAVSLENAGNMYGAAIEAAPPVAATTLANMQAATATFANVLTRLTPSGAALNFYAVSK